MCKSEGALDTLREYLNAHPTLRRRHEHEKAVSQMNDGPAEEVMRTAIAE